MLFKSGISIRFENWGEGGRGGGHFWYGDNSFLNQLSDEKSNRNTFIFISFSPLIIHITSLHRPNLKVNVRFGGFLLRFFFLACKKSYPLSNNAKGVLLGRRYIFDVRRSVTSYACIFIFFHYSVYKRFKSLAPNPEAVTKATKLSRDELYALPEIKVRVWSKEKNINPNIDIEKG